MLATTVPALAKSAGRATVAMTFRVSEVPALTVPRTVAGLKLRAGETAGAAGSGAALPPPPQPPHPVSRAASNSGRR